MSDLTEAVLQIKAQEAFCVLRQPNLGLDTQSVDEGGEEKPLESHEVIELQTFSERKAWIEGKIQVWEQQLFRLPLIFISFSFSNLYHP